MVGGRSKVQGGPASDVARELQETLTHCRAREERMRERSRVFGETDEEIVEDPVKPQKLIGRG